MLLAFQLICAALLVLSLVLVVGVTVSFALPENWAQTKGWVLSGTGIWFMLVIAVGVLNFFVSLHFEI
jgi:photosystem II PsbZ protein